MDLQEQYDELDNIVITLGMLVNETTDKYYIDMLNDIKCEAREERDKIQETLWGKEKKELTEQNREFEESRL